MITFAAVDIKTPNVSNLVKKKLTITEISETESKITTDHDRDKYITIHEFYKLQQNILLQD